tara:strand:- start:17707 stop:18609 length:903 start_codon:yes stop_codon:yes gene_type:complete
MSKQIESSDQPNLSVIIPYQDNLKEVEDIILTLENQSYPSEKIELLLIYNSSLNGLNRNSIPVNSEIKFEFLEEKIHLNSPYSARNRGIERATGDIIVFIDANSTPDKCWLEIGINFLIEMNYDLVAGKVDFDFGERITAAKIVDSLTSIDMKNAVEGRGVAYTANLFVKKDVFYNVGTFEEKTRSGGDVRFTKKAVKTGYKIGFCENSLVWKKARDFKSLYQKKIRTGKGYFYTWKDDEEKRIWFYNLLRAFKPPTSKRFKQNHDQVSSVVIWFHLYLVGIVEQLAFIAEYIKYNLRSD